MKDPDFELFVRTFGEAADRVSVPEECFDKWTNVLPASLLSYWREDGWASYGSGRLWTVNPDDYRDVKDAWLEQTPFASIDTYHVYARSGFGRLYLCGEASGRGASIDPIGNEVFALQNCLRFKSLDRQDGGIRAFFACRDLEDFDCRDDEGELLFERALDRLGRLRVDEMYGFEPALALGGNICLEGMRRVKIQQHLHLLRELEPPSFPKYSVGVKPLIKR